ncbi:hypothetical protein COLO4_08679 [Corchorus olitorius]|uniref:Uncharacterized protein n=1 Tax=Corchorus olitorius TaxID=93759 RepID=A0A1R3KEX0_9ROSI|nr:hypothetical protein COLO4_08679 [Corchorus olitorius]
MGRPSKRSISLLFRLANPTCLKPNSVDSIRSGPSLQFPTLAASLVSMSSCMHGSSSSLCVESEASQVEEASSSDSLIPAVGNFRSELREIKSQATSIKIGTSKLSPLWDMTIFEGNSTLRFTEARTTYIKSALLVGAIVDRNKRTLQVSNLCKERVMPQL